MNICIFGASSENIKDIYKQTTYQLGLELAKAGHGLVFGGGKFGLMGAAVRGFKAGGGKTVGIAPVIFDSNDILYEGLDERIITNDLTDRKAKMIEMSDAFIAVAGGIGTYDELFEVLVGKQLDYFHKPIILYNIDHYYDKLIDFLDHTYEEGFMRHGSGHLFHVASCPEDVLAILDRG